MPTNSTPIDTLDETIAGLGRVKQWMLDHPEIEFCSLSLYTRKVSAQVARNGSKTGERFAAAARALMDGAPKGAVTKDLTESIYSVARDFDGFELDIFTSRETVCEAKVVGTETVRVPDPEAPMVTVTRDLIEWECKPLLAAETEAVAS